MIYLSFVQAILPNFPLNYNVLFWGVVSLLLGLFLGYLYGLYKYIILHWGEVKVISEEIEGRKR